MKIVETSDKQLSQEIKEKLKKTGGYCPCRLSKTPETKCMCKEFRDKIKRNEPGACHCGLFEVVDDH